MPLSPTASPLSRDTWTRAAIVLIVGCAVLRITALAISPVSLYQDESQYWVWSRHFDWGYYSKPPMIAWLISLSTGLLGDSDFAIRLPATLLHTGTAIFLMLGARQLWDERTGFWTAALYLTMPGIWLSGFVISTDAVLFLAWSGGLFALLRLRADGSWGAAIGLGFALGFGFLSKYAMIYFLVSTGLAISFDAPYIGWMAQQTLGRNPLGHSGFDIASFGMGLFSCTDKAQLEFRMAMAGYEAPTNHQMHHALADSVAQGHTLAWLLNHAECDQQG